MSAGYREPGWFTRNVFNQLVAWLTRHGISVLGSRVLAVKGRTSGQWRTTPVNLLQYEGRRYLVAPRGETQWVRNLRVAGTGELRLGSRAEPFRGRELGEEEKLPVLRAYLKRWKAEVGIFFEGTGPDSTDEQIRAIAPKHPAFEVTRVDGGARLSRRDAADNRCGQAFGQAGWRRGNRVTGRVEEQARQDLAVYRAHDQRGDRLGVGG
jgi:hypothetical protein